MAILKDQDQSNMSAKSRWKSEKFPAHVEEARNSDGNVHKGFNLLEFRVAAELLRIGPYHSAEDYWAPVDWQLLLLVSEYMSALLEFLDWFWPELGWEHHKQAIVLSKRMLQPRSPNTFPNLPIDPQLHAAWRAFTYCFWHGTRHLAAVTPVGVSTATYVAARDWLNKLVGERGFEEEGPITSSLMSWTESMRPRLQEAFPNTSIDWSKWPAVTWPDPECACRSVEKRGAVKRQTEEEYAVRWPLRVTQGRPKFNHAKVEARDGFVVAIPSMKNPPVLSFLAVSDVMTSFKQAAAKWPSTTADSPSQALQQEMAQSFVQNVLRATRGPLAPGIAHEPYKYLGYVACCVQGWETALPHILTVVRETGAWGPQPLVLPGAPLQAATGLTQLLNAAAAAPLPHAFLQPQPQLGQQGAGGGAYGLPPAGGGLGGMPPGGGVGGLGMGMVMGGTPEGGLSLGIAEHLAMLQQQHHHMQQMQQQQHMQHMQQLQQQHQMRQMQQQQHLQQVQQAGGVMGGSAMHGMAPPGMFGGFMPQQAQQQPQPHQIQLPPPAPLVLPQHMQPQQVPQQQPVAGADQAQLGAPIPVVTVHALPSTVPAPAGQAGQPSQVGTVSQGCASSPEGSAGDPPQGAGAPAGARVTRTRPSPFAASGARKPAAGGAGGAAAAGIGAAAGAGAAGAPVQGQQGGAAGGGATATAGVEGGAAPMSLGGLSSMQELLDVLPEPSNVVDISWSALMGTGTLGGMPLAGTGTTTNMLMDMADKDQAAAAAAGGAAAGGAGVAQGAAGGPGGAATGGAVAARAQPVAGAGAAGVAGPAMARPAGPASAFSAAAGAWAAAGLQPAAGGAAAGGAAAPAAAGASTPSPNPASPAPQLQPGLQQPVSRPAAAAGATGMAAGGLTTFNSAMPLGARPGGEAGPSGAGALGGFSSVPLGVGAGGRLGGLAGMPDAPVHIQPPSIRAGSPFQGTITTGALPAASTGGRSDPPSPPLEFGATLGGLGAGLSTMSFGISGAGPSLNAALAGIGGGMGAGGVAAPDPPLPPRLSHGEVFTSIGPPSPSGAGGGGGPCPPSPGGGGPRVSEGGSGGSGGAAAAGSPTGTASGAAGPQRRSVTSPFSRRSGDGGAAGRGVATGGRRTRGDLAAAAAAAAAETGLAPAPGSIAEPATKRPNSQNDLTVPHRAVPPRVLVTAERVESLGMYLNEEHVARASHQLSQQPHVSATAGVPAGATGGAVPSAAETIKVEIHPVVDSGPDLGAAVAAASPPGAREAAAAGSKAAGEDLQARLQRLLREAAAVAAQLAEQDQQAARSLVTETMRDCPTLGALLGGSNAAPKGQGTDVPPLANGSAPAQ
ncbi:hypothetical protein HYH02_000052 [Chlamydomonas schloesseri]|uniref:Uncharacterized protein n=1 Tax=Chlamydomonas schloesseri TaxID=2026947 RepID=A0A836B7Q9_9CHLO|nr:hypothetical protein HYH02_000052 [Chlamydomonas schloesseri]|eukprot:KAG2449948.1 hypothetical protein HYH02_000052 [Chlamydomonas schloesseri]